MARPAHPHSMAPSGPGRTRTAPPQMPAQFPMSGRYLTHTLFGATGILYLLCGFGALRAVWMLGSGPTAWAAFQREYESAPLIVLHVVCLAAVIFVGVRFFSLFPKSQPAKIGPAKPPPRPVIHAMLYAAWIAVSGGLALVMAGGIFR
jgi:fumarate reductase subunit C